MASVLIRQDKGFGFYSKRDGRLLQCFLQGIHRVQFSFFKVTLAAGRACWEGSAVGKRAGFH